jgi:N-acetylglucosaminyldiphosphoundecaprenol N-acetyl-beta-D-mannosaminyltransferase
VPERAAGDSGGTENARTGPGAGSGTGQGDTVVLFGLTVDRLTMRGVLQRCRDSLHSRSPLLIGVVNAAKVVNLGRDVRLRESILECDLVVADGQSVVWASRLLRRPLPTRVAGIDLFAELLRTAAEEDRGVYLLGARPDVLDTLRARLVERFPRLRIVGARDGYFTEDDEEEVAAGIRDSGADMLFLGITSPKKENFLHRWGDTLDVPVQHGVGGSFDVFAGVTRRAPGPWQRLGLEWAYRMLQEPRRLGPRYLTTNTAFVWLTLREMVRPRPAYPLPPTSRRPGVPS